MTVNNAVALNVNNHSTALRTNSGLAAETNLTAYVNKTTAKVGSTVSSAPQETLSTAQSAVGLAADLATPTTGSYEESGDYTESGGLSDSSNTTPLHHHVFSGSPGALSQQHSVAAEFNNTVEDDDVDKDNRYDPSKTSTTGVSNAVDFKETEEESDSDTRSRKEGDYNDDGDNDDDEEDHSNANQNKLDQKSDSTRDGGNYEKEGNDDDYNHDDEKTDFSNINKFLNGEADDREVNRIDGKKGGTETNNASNNSKSSNNNVEIVLEVVVPDDNANITHSQTTVISGRNSNNVENMQTTAIPLTSSTADFNAASVTPPSATKAPEPTLTRSEPRLASEQGNC
jgi:hypothetical protein